MSREYTAGGGRKLNIIRYGRDEMTKHERQAAGGNNSVSAIYPGMALMRSQSADTPTFVPHDGSVDTDVYVAVEARQRGMDAQTDNGYETGQDEVIAVRASGGGLNLRVSDGENVSEDDALVPEPDTGNFVVRSSEDTNIITGYASEDNDLSGASNPALVGAEAE
jgi:hypothetical protein